MVDNKKEMFEFCFQTALGSIYFISTGNKKGSYFEADNGIVRFKMSSEFEEGQLIRLDDKKYEDYSIHVRPEKSRIQFSFNNELTDNPSIGAVPTDSESNGNGKHKGHTIRRASKTGWSRC